ncbi:MAG: hypothetical protein CVU53_05065 [Deltaproteobacteria bacterium HGW-Deltaproteobacteria-11]|nr:MAG: hypothetical protein CVU53_05065 [Deltaproteobacteria bacterium HGW-Deltaproteobacteria-11]
MVLTFLRNFANRLYIVIKNVAMIGISRGIFFQDIPHFHGPTGGHAEGKSLKREAFLEKKQKGQPLYLYF